MYQELNFFCFHHLKCDCSTKLSRAGLLKDAEAEHLVEKVEEHLDNISCCHEKVHSGEVDIDFQGVWDETNDEHIGGIKNGEDNHKDF